MYSDLRDKSGQKQALWSIYLMTPIVIIIAIVNNCSSNKIRKAEACIVRIERIRNCSSQLKVHYKFITEEAEYLGIECIDTSVSNTFIIGDTVQVEFKKKSPPESRILIGKTSKR